VFALSLRSVRRRSGRFLVTLLAAFLGATVVMTFHSMHGTAGDGVDPVSAGTLGPAAARRVLRTPAVSAVAAAA
jgi:putative ABC transport system permease protein